MESRSDCLLALPWVGLVPTVNCDWVIAVWELHIQLIRGGTRPMYALCTRPVGPVSVLMYTKPLMSSTLHKYCLHCKTLAYIQDSVESR